MADKTDTLLERLVEHRAQEMIHATLSVATERIAEELAREALKDDTFRRMFREMVRQRSQAILDRLLANGGGRKRPRRMRPR